MRVRILVTGATGFVGRNLLSHLERAGHHVSLVSRRPNVGCSWAEPELAAAIQRHDAVIHLAGAGVFDARWSAARKREILESRVATTASIARLCAAAGNRRLVSTSAVGFYASDVRDGDEDSPPGNGFLSEVCRRWEEALAPAIAAGVPTAWIRAGVVLGRGGGAFQRMLLPFKLGLGGTLGSGTQPFPWIHVADLCRAYAHLATHADLRGAFNGVAPHVCDQRTFARTLGKVLARPAVLPAPAFALRLALGERATMLLEGQAVAPRRLLEAGFQFDHLELEAALRDLVATPRAPARA